MKTLLKIVSSFASTSSSLIVFLLSAFLSAFLLSTPFQNKTTTLGTTREVVLDRQSSYKTPLSNDHRQNMAALGRFLVFTPTVNVL